jgi:RNA recognition motif-containing protein
MTTATQTANSYESWENFISDPLDFPPATPLTRLCSVDLLTDTDWVDNLINSEAKPSQSVQTEYNDKLEDNSVEISNFDPEGITENGVASECAPFGDIESIDISEKRFGRICVKFFDIRSAYAIVRSRICVRGFKWIIQFGDSELQCYRNKRLRERTVFIFHVPQGVTTAMIHQEFSKFGEIREIRESRHKFIEFWDSRSAARAIQGTHGKILFGVKLRVRLSRPSNSRANFQACSDRRMPTVARISKIAKGEVKIEKGDDQKLNGSQKSPQTCRYSFFVDKTV